MEFKDNGFRIIDLTPENIAGYGVCGYKDVEKHLELRRKIEWFKRYYSKGLRIKALITDKGGYQGMLEYIPGEYAHRPVKAPGYMFIHCLFVGFRKEFKGMGYASLMIEECIKEAREANMLGVAVVTRNGSFMANSSIFLKKGFVKVDSAKPDFELLALKFDNVSANPVFHINIKESYKRGLIILRSPQCPYSVKNVEAILQTAGKMELSPELIELADHISAQASPAPFGTFCIVRDGVVLSHHPISNTRFENIMRK
jgi:GNAT superfamily N-acetyltransferase